MRGAPALSLIMKRVAKRRTLSTDFRSVGARGNISAEVERWPNGVPRGPGPVRQQIVKEAPVDQICLYPQAKVPGCIPVEAAAKTVKAGPVELGSGGNQLRHNRGCYRIGRTGCNPLADRSQRRPQEKCDRLVMP